MNRRRNANKVTRPQTSHARKNSRAPQFNNMRTGQYRPIGKPAGMVVVAAGARAATAGMLVTAAGIVVAPPCEIVTFVTCTVVPPALKVLVVIDGEACVVVDAPAYIFGADLITMNIAGTDDATKIIGAPVIR